MKRQRAVLFSYDLVTEESAAEGDTDQHGWADLEGGRYPIEGSNVPKSQLVDVHEGAKLATYPVASAREAVDLIRENMGALEPSSSEFHVGVWYTEEAEQDMDSGDYESKSAHLHGFDPREEAAIWNELVARRGHYRRATAGGRR